MASSSIAASDPNLDTDLALAERLARVAGDVALAYVRKGGMGVWTKGMPSNVVTDADLAAQDAMLAMLATERPQDGAQAEEGLVATPGARQWVLDPIDGTLAYHRGLPMWSTAVALRDHDGWAITAVFDPLASEMFTAQRDSGALLNGVPIKSARTERLSQAVIHTWLDADCAGTPGFAAFLERIVANSLAMKSGGSGSQAMAWVAAGRLDAFVEVYTHGENEWDWLPGSHLVQQAGGAVCATGNWRIAASTTRLVDAIGGLLPPAAGS
jgi:myo-inositol-1(or 4)-monophosphatase